MAKTLPPPAPRRPAAAPSAESLAAAEAYVAGQTPQATSAPSAPVVSMRQDTRASDASSAPAPQGTEAPRPLGGKRKLVPRSDGRLVRRLVAYFEPDLAKRLERWCVDHESDVSAAIVEAVRRMLAGAEE